MSDEGTLVIIGIDFGTTNSGMAAFDGREVRLLGVDPANANPAVARTALYVSNDHSVSLGRAAVNRYFDENVGRPVKMQKIWVGEVEVYGADMFYVTDVYVWADVLSPGRLFLSIKSGLRDPEFQGTVIGQFYYSLENLIAVYLSGLKYRGEQILGREVREVVLGRPVRFSLDPKADALAQRRLLDAAFLAGFEKVYLQYEPVAAAYHYAANVGKVQNILVFDFGGGTLDTTIMRLGGREERRVLATGGLPIAGDVFDQKVVRAKLPKYFGDGSTYGPPGKRLPLPSWIYDVFSDWQRIIELQRPNNLQLLRDIAQTSDDRQGIQGLISLVSNNYGLLMFDTVEQAKQQLSDDMATFIRMKGPKFTVNELLTRSDFEKIIRADIQRIERHLDETILESGLRPGQIDAVVRTGGSSNIPAFRYMLMEKFGKQKVQAIDTFSSVTSGLAVIGHGIGNGMIEAQAHEPFEKRPSQQQLPRQHIKPVNLEIFKRRFQLAEKESAATADKSKRCLLQLSDNGHLSVLGRPVAHQDANYPDIQEPLHHPLVQASKDEFLLLVTSRYRFFLTSAAQLEEAKEVGLSLENYFHLKAQEQISLVQRWQAIRQAHKMILVTSLGFARGYPLNGLVEQVEGPLPYQFDQPLPGVPAAVFGAHEEDWLVLALSSARGLRFAVADFPIQGFQAIKRSQGEGLCSADLARLEDEIVLITGGGYARRLKAEGFPAAEKPNQAGRVLVARRPLQSMIRLKDGKQLWIATNLRPLQPISLDRIPLDAPDTSRSYRLLKLKAGEKITAATQL